MNVQIRTAGPDDAALLHELAAATFPLACPPDTLPEAIDAFINTTLSEASFAGYLADASRDLFIAEIDGSAVGYTMLITEQPQDRDVAAVVTANPVSELSKVYVLAGHHGSGVAATLVQATVEAARSRGSVAVWLGVNQFNPKANRFYEKQGFVQVGVKSFRLGDRLEEDFVRALEL